MIAPRKPTHCHGSDRCAIHNGLAPDSDISGERHKPPVDFISHTRGLMLPARLDQRTLDPRGILAAVSSGGLCPPFGVIRRRVAHAWWWAQPTRHAVPFGLRGDRAMAK